MNKLKYSYDEKFIAYEQLSEEYNNMILEKNNISSEN
jgi:hypothetical protein